MRYSEHLAELCNAVAGLEHGDLPSARSMQELLRWLQGRRAVLERIAERHQQLVDMRRQLRALLDCPGAALHAAVAAAVAELDRALD